MKFFENTIEASFLSRKNRFIVECLLNNKKVLAYLPNPGRLFELLYKGVTLILTDNLTSGKLRFTVIGVKKGDIPVMLHTHISNKVVKLLIEENLLEDYHNCKILKEEFTVGKSRFDFLIERDGAQKALEIKTCTLFHNRIAMFPDAVTERGTRHLFELAKIGGELIFLIQTKEVDFFLPEFNIDINFAKALLAVKDLISIKAYAISWKDDLTLNKGVKEVAIPWQIVESHLHDSGSYLLLLSLTEDSVITIGEKGDIPFKRGYYVYVGSGKKNLTKRIERHKKIRKNNFWHIDYLRARCDYITAFPIRTHLDLECELAQSLLRLSDWHIKGFGASDCKCVSHLFGFLENPLTNKDFIDLVLTYRMGILWEEIKTHQDVSFL